MAGCRCTALQSRPRASLDCTSRTLAECQPLVPPCEAACHARMAAGRAGWEAADRAPVDRLPQLSPAATGRAPLVYPGLPETVCAPGRAGALVREGAAHSQALEAPPLAGPAGRTPCPRGCPSPLADRLGPAARRRGGGRTHDKPLADATPSPLPAGSRPLPALGGPAVTLPPRASVMPTKPPHA